jgi:hypothetical protein
MNDEDFTQTFTTGWIDLPQDPPDFRIRLDELMKTRKNEKVTLSPDYKLITKKEVPKTD